MIKEHIVRFFSTETRREQFRQFGFLLMGIGGFFLSLAIYGRFEPYIDSFAMFLWASLFVPYMSFVFSSTFGLAVGCFTFGALFIGVYISIEKLEEYRSKD